MDINILDWLLPKAKQFLSIIETSRFKDEEIKTLIVAGALELERSGIDLTANADENGFYSEMIVTAIMMFLKSNFGNVDVKEKELTSKTFNSLQQALSLSEIYKKESEGNV